MIIYLAAEHGNGVIREEWMFDRGCNRLLSYFVFIKKESIIFKTIKRRIDCADKKNIKSN